MDFDIVLPYQFYNLIMLLVTIFSLLWGLKAVKRFYRVLRIRSAVLSDSMVQIRGLGSYLSYFEGATRNHIYSIVHTRQTKPPISMAQIVVGATVNSFSLVRKETTYRDETSLRKTPAVGIGFDIRLEKKIPCRVFFLFGFQSTNFRRVIALLRREMSVGNSVVGIGDNMVERMLGKSNIVGNECVDMELPRLVHVLPNLVQHEVCITEAFMQLAPSITDNADNQVCFPLSNSMMRVVNDKLKHATPHQAQPPQQALADVTSSNSDGSPSVGDSPAACSTSVSVAVVLVPLHSAKSGEMRRGQRTPNVVRGQTDVVNGVAGVGRYASHRDGAINPLAVPSRGDRSGSKRTTCGMGVGGIGDHAGAGADADVEAGGGGLLTESDPDSELATLYPGPEQVGSGWAGGEKEGPDSGSAYESGDMAAAVFVYNIPSQRLSPNFTPHAPSERDNATSEQSSSSSDQNRPVVMQPSEVLVLSRESGALLCSQEVFGLAAAARQEQQIFSPAGSSASSSSRTVDGMIGNGEGVRRQSATPATGADLGSPLQPSGGEVGGVGGTQTASVAAPAVCTGGRFVHEDCVVCMSDSKAVLLLPCRCVILSSRPPVWHIYVAYSFAVTCDRSTVWVFAGSRLTLNLSCALP